MKPVYFPEATHVLGPPPGVSECSPLPIKRVEGDVVEMVSCWELEPGDLESIQRSGRVWLRVSGRGHPMVSLEVEPVPKEPEHVSVTAPPVVGHARGPNSWQ